MTRQDNGAFFEKVGHRRAYLAVKAVTQSDIHAVVAVVFIVGLVFLAANLIVDVLLYVISPRKRSEA